MQKAGCSLTTKCHNNHPTAIFQPERCQGSRAGNASNVGSQQSRCPSQTSLQSLMHCMSRRPAVIPKQLWGVFYQHCLPTAKGNITKFPKCLLKQGKTNCLSQKQPRSAGSEERSRSLFPPLSSPWQGSFLWEHVIIGPYQCYTQNRSLPHFAKGTYRS